MLYGISNLKELIEHLNERNIDLDEWHVSFNGLGFDSQIIEFIIKNKYKLLSMSNEDLVDTLYNVSLIISSSTKHNSLAFCFEASILNK